MQMQICLPIVSVAEEPGWRRRRWTQIRRVLCLAGSVTQMWRGRCEGPMLVQRQAATGPSWPPFSLGTTAAAAEQATFGIWKN